MNYSRFITQISAARTDSPIRKTTAIALRNPNILTLAAGWPNPEMFPFNSAKLTTRDGVEINFEGKKMQQSLQYAASQGVPSLLNWVEKLHLHYHNPPIMNNPSVKFKACITSGSQDGLSKIFGMIANPGDNILLDNPCYAGTLSMLRPYKYNLLPVGTDHHGMRSDSLLEVLRHWKPEDALNPKSNIPKVIYTIPSCGNPTGVTASFERKQEIYKIAQDYDIIIVEDDPYYYLQFDELVPSYQSIDVDGRVIRSDSMSKVMSSGLRLGWVSGAETFINRLILHQETSTVHSSTFGQMIVASLLEQWGLEGFIKHVAKVQDFYKKQRDSMLRCMNDHMTEFAEWNKPLGGMFIWMKLNGIADTSDLINKTAKEKEVLLLPGSVFEVDAGKSSPHCRASYSFASEEVMDEALRRFADVIKNELRSKKA